MRKTAPTVEDVAAAAGVSTATVSRALNQPESVRPALRSRVLASVEDLGYVAHAGARALTLRSSRTVGVVVPTIDNAIFASGLQAFQKRMTQSGYMVLLAFSDYDAEQEEAQVRVLMARGVDAVALTGLSQRPSLIERLRQRGLPWVHTGAFPAQPGSACVGFRNRKAIMRAVQYLLDLGHQRFAMLAGITEGNERAAERLAGVRDALAAAGLQMAPAAVVQSPYSVERGRHFTRQLLSLKPRPTALLCGNDVLAFGAMLECQAQQIDVPLEMSIVGFDDLDMARQWQPGLSTVHVPIEAMWTQAAEYLLGRLDGSQTQVVQRELQVELVVRGSTGRAPKAKPRR